MPFRREAPSIRPNRHESSNAPDMNRSRPLDALVLRTHDVGEADRFCIFLTAEEGKVAARAAGARRPTSRIGAALVPFSEVRILLKESSAGNIVASAQRTEEGFTLGLSAFGQASEGAELLLRLLQDEESVPGVFPLTISFLRACAFGLHDAYPRFGLRLLHLLGLLPAAENARRLHPLTREDATYLSLVTGKSGDALWTAEEPLGPRLTSLLSLLLGDHLSSPLKATGVSDRLRRL